MGCSSKTWSQSGCRDSTRRVCAGLQQRQTQKAEVCFCIQLRQQKGSSQGF